MFIDNIKYTLTTLVVALFSLTFVASCGSSNSGDRVSTIIKESTGPMCDEIPYGVCVTGAVFDGLQFEAGRHEQYLSTIHQLQSRLSSQDIREARALFRDHRTIEEKWDKLQIGREAGDLNVFEHEVLWLLDMYLTAEEFMREVQEIDYGWIVSNQRKIETAIEKGGAFNSQIGIQMLLYLSSHYGLRNLLHIATLSTEAGLLDQFRRPIEPKIAEHQKYVERLIQQRADLAEELARGLR